MLCLTLINPSNDGASRYLLPYGRGLAICRAALGKPGTRRSARLGAARGSFRPMNAGRCRPARHGDVLSRPGDLIDRAAGPPLTLGARDSYGEPSVDLYLPS